MTWRTARSALVFAVLVLANAAPAAAQDGDDELSATELAAGVYRICLEVARFKLRAYELAWSIVTMERLDDSTRVKILFDVDRSLQSDLAAAARLMRERHGLRFEACEAIE